MVWTIAKIVISASVITFSSWLADKRPGLAGLILALPISTMLALGLQYSQFKNPERSVEYARAILLGIPLSLTFFIPFLLADRLKWSFPALYCAGVAILSVVYFATIRVRAL